MATGEGFRLIIVPVPTSTKLRDRWEPLNVDDQVVSLIDSFTKLGASEHTVVEPTSQIEIATSSATGAAKMN